MGERVLIENNKRDLSNLVVCGCVLRTVKITLVGNGQHLNIRTTGQETAMDS